MLRLNALYSVLVLSLSACIESPPPSFQPINNADMATDSDTQADMDEDVVITPDMPDIDEPICFGEGDCPNDMACKVNEADSNLNECVECLDANDCTMGVCKEDNTCVACIEDSDCGDPRLTCSDNECVGCLDGGACPAIADRCDPESEAPGTCVECLGDGNDTLCGERPCDPESRRCVPCLPGDESAGIQDTCAGNTGSPHCKVDENDTLNNKCVECLASSDCAMGGCDTNTNTCVNCVEDEDCEGEFVCTQEADLSARMCVPCLGDSCDTGVCKEDASDPSQNTCVECLDDECSGGEVCNPATNLCVECVDNGECSGGVCDTDNTCVECLSNTDCPGEVCDTSIKECVACLGDTDCTGTNQCRINATDSTQNACVTCVNNDGCQSPSASVCNSAANSCGVCQQITDCNHLAATYNYCDGGCIQCYGISEQTDCGTTFCDLSTNMCSTTTFGTAPDRSSCTSSDQCTAGSRCVPLTYQGAMLGTYCMPLTSMNSPLCSGPYGAGRKTKTTVEGHSVLVCMIDEERTTPEAIVEASFQNACTLSGDTCQDKASQCVLKDVSNRMCTYPCLNNTHCDANDGLACKCPGLLNTCAAADRRCLP